jgi:hypothetical protein
VEPFDLMSESEFVELVRGLTAEAEAGETV